MDLPPQPAVPGEFSLLRALLNGLIPDTWESDFYTHHLEARSRLLLSQASKGCQGWVLNRADRATVALHAKQGLPEAAWRRRQAAAEQALAQRPGRDNTLALRMFSFSYTAQHSLLKVAPAAGSAVTELSVQSFGDWVSQDSALYTAWLQKLPTVFSNLRTLQLDRVRGCLPPPTLLPHLTELRLTLWPTRETYRCPARSRCSIEDMCQSIAPYLAQIHTLQFDTIRKIWRPIVIPWAQLFQGVSPTLTVFETGKVITDELVGVLCERTPNLATLIVEFPAEYEEQLTDRHAGEVWSVQSIGNKAGEYRAGQLALLPRSAGGSLRLLGHGTACPSVKYEVASAEGLSDAVLERMSHWQPKEPYTATLTQRDGMRADDEQAGYLAALQQLTNLPTDTVLSLGGQSNTGKKRMERMARALTAAAPALLHVKVLSPFAHRRFMSWGEDDERYPNREMFTLADLCDESPPFRHVRVVSVDRKNEEGCEDVCDIHPWPWESLTFEQGVLLGDLLYLPDPTGGQYDILVHEVDLRETTEVKTEDRHKLITRFQHWTFVVNDNCNIILLPRYGKDSAQPKELRMQFEVLGLFRWRFEQHASISITFIGWTVTQALMHELRALPTHWPRVTVTFRKCIWLPADKCDYTQLLASIPTHYSVIILESNWEAEHKYTTQHVLDVCRGAPARGREAERCVVRCVNGRDDDHELSQRVEAFVRTHGLQPFLAGVEWREPLGSRYDSDRDSDRDYDHGSDYEYDYPYRDDSPEPSMSEGGPSESENEPRSEDRYERRSARMSPTWSDEGSF